MKFIYKMWFVVGGFLLWLWDVLRGVVFVSYNDCAQDTDGKARIAIQMAFDRASGQAFGVRNSAELGYCLLTALQRTQFAGRPIILHGNVAVRSETGNGPNFCVARIGRNWVIATEGGYTWSALRLFGLVDRVYRVDFAASIGKLASWGLINEAKCQELCDTQFRSVLLTWLLRFQRLGIRLPGEWVKVEDISVDLNQLWQAKRELAVGYRDAFQNTYLLATAKMLGLAPGGCAVVFSENHNKAVALEFVRRLKDVPLGRSCLVEVSSGYGGEHLMGIEAKKQPNSKGRWRDFLPGWHSGMRIRYTNLPSAKTIQVERFLNALPVGWSGESITLYSVKEALAKAECSWDPEEVYQVIRKR